MHRRIRDNQHGTIAISAFEDRLIASPLLQRLRYIRQLGFFHLVFPGAQHSRFEHSLGVMHLAGECFVKLKQNLERAQGEDIVRARQADHAFKSSASSGVRLAYELSSGLFASEYAFNTLRVAALLHDVGHCPYSHCSERFLPTFEAIFQHNPDLPLWLRQAMRQADSTAERAEATATATQSCHEAFSLMLAWHILTQLEQAGECLVYKEDVLAVLNPAVAIHPDSPFHPDRGKDRVVGFVLLRDLLSGLWDVDRMDYLKRDSQQAGVPYGEFDADRIIYAMYPLYDEQTSQYCFGFHIQAAPALEGFLRARQSMFLQIYFHKTSVASEAMILRLCRLLHGWSFPGNIHEYAALRDQDLESILRRRLDEVSFMTAGERTEALALIDGLFWQRQLWKNVFEVQSTTAQDHHQAQARARDFHQTLVARNIAAEVIMSSSRLAREQDMRRSGGGDKYRWLTQDSLGYLISTQNPLQDLLEHHPPFWMVRVYVEPAAYLEAKTLRQQFDQN